jgi:hypothetical protein
VSPAESDIKKKRLHQPVYECTHIREKRKGVKEQEKRKEIIIE